MTKKTGLSALTEQLFGKRSIDRLRLSKMLFSGELEARRAQRVKEGDLPWRILHYRRTVDPEKVGYPISNYHLVLPDTLDTHLSYLTKNCRVVSLDTLADLISENRPIPEKTVALTFDGGWIDNFVYAYPLLLKHRVPATMFLPTAFIGTTNYFWQDKIMFALVIMMQKGLPFLPFDFFGPEERALVQRVSPGGAIDLPLIFVVISILALRTPPERFQALSILGSVVQKIGGDLPAEPAFMSWDDAKLMDAGGISFGSMSHKHALFTEMTPEAIRQDIRAADELLNQNFKHVSSVFCLPEAAVSAAALRVLAEENIEFTVGQHEGQIITAAGAPSILPRVSLFEANSASTETFACRLWLGEDALTEGGE
ncbi:MAG: polysaccharide deacetylase family protein [Bdellovibrionota bacterium]